MNWFELLRQAVDAASITQVAEKLGYSRTAISLALSGNYGAKSDKIAARVLEVYCRFECPHLGTSISAAECAHYSSRAVPTSSPRQLKHWRACQTCEISPKGDKQ